MQFYAYSGFTAVEPDFGRVDIPASVGTALDECASECAEHTVRDYCRVDVPSGNGGVVVGRDVFNGGIERTLGGFGEVVLEQYYFRAAVLCAYENFIVVIV